MWDVALSMMIAEVTNKAREFAWCGKFYGHMQSFPLIRGAWTGEAQLQHHGRLFG